VPSGRYVYQRLKLFHEEPYLKISDRVPRKGVKRRSRKKYHRLEYEQCMLPLSKNQICPAHGAEKASARQHCSSV